MGTAATTDPQYQALLGDSTTDARLSSRRGACRVQECRQGSPVYSYAFFDKYMRWGETGTMPLRDAMIPETIRLRLVGLGNNVFPCRSCSLIAPHLLHQYVILHDLILRMHILPSTNLILAESEPP